MGVHTARLFTLSSRELLFPKGAISSAHGSLVVKALCYKPEGRGFEIRWGKLIFSIYLIIPAALGPGVYSVSNINEYQKQKNNASGE
jgi:hypothetical protein